MSTRKPKPIAAPGFGFAPTPGDHLTPEQRRANDANIRAFLRTKAEHDRIRCAAPKLLEACKLAIPHITDASVLEQLNAAIAIALGLNTERTDR